MRAWSWLTIKLLVDHLRKAPESNESVIAPLQQVVVRWAIKLRCEGRLDLTPALYDEDKA